ncbi:MAG: hypothetical protein QNJ53_13300, partial [Pleurocapsa sp. MO_192.B19]|nr:hypothetical protein [Pleurocapsa sp. MO_192.B19]
MNNRELTTVEQRKPHRFSFKQQQPLVQTLHNRVKGRVRYKVRGLQGSENLQQYLEFRLSTAPGIDRVRASSWSGNILIIFTKERSPKAMPSASCAIASLIKTIVKEYRKDPQKAIELMQKWSETNSQSSNHIPLESWHIQETAAILTELET